MRIASRPRSVGTALALILLLLLGSGSAAPVHDGQEGLAAPSHVPDQRCDGGTVHSVPASGAVPTSPVPGNATQAIGRHDAGLLAVASQIDNSPRFLDIHFIPSGPTRYIVWFPADAVLPDLTYIDAAFPVVAAHAPGPAAPALLERAGDADPPLVPGPCGNDRPGGIFGPCPFAFLLQGDNGKTYATTAGHCLPAVGQRVTLGTVAFKRAAGIGIDFGLIEIDPIRVPHMSPAVCHWGGPTAPASALTPAAGDLLRWYGPGFPAGATDATQPRQGVLVAYGLASFMYVGPVFPGDSGAPVALATGEALGVHTQGLSGANGVSLPVSNPMVKFGMRLDAGMALAEAELGIALTLWTAPLA